MQRMINHIKNPWLIGTLITVTALLLMCHLETSAKTSNPYGEPVKMRCTLYIDHGVTKSGQTTRKGIIAAKKEWLGKTAILYQLDKDGNIVAPIGIYECLDTGYGINGSLINGTSIDVWVENMDEVRAWQKEYGDYVGFQLIQDSEG